MFIRAYLRASTEEQDATRAVESLRAFVKERGYKIAATYIERASGAKLDRPELLRLIDESEAGDVLLVEQVDRLSRLRMADWETLKAKLALKRIRVVSLDLPTSHLALSRNVLGDAEDATAALIDAVNRMLLDVLAVAARKDYTDRRRRAAQGIEKGKALGRFKGRPVDAALHERIGRLLDVGMTWGQIQDMLTEPKSGRRPSRSTIKRVVDARKAHAAPSA